VGPRAGPGVSDPRPPFLSYGRQSVDDHDVAAVVEALRSDRLTTGPQVEALETALAAYCGAKHAVAVANGTAALHVAMLAAGIGPGHRVLTSANTFLASANCGVYVGAQADFADIDPRTYNVSAATLDRAWSDDVKAVVPVDFAGQPCEMPAIAELARQRGALIIEDAAHAIGSRFRHAGAWYRTGGHPWADLTTFSFHPVKTITTGEGGAVVTDDATLARRCRLFRNHGMTRESAGFQGLGDTTLAEAGPWYYEMSEIGYNYRLTDIQCALGTMQLQKLDGFIRRRAEIVAAYNEAFARLPSVTLPYQAPETEVAWHLYVLQIDFPAVGRSRTEVMRRFAERRIGTQVHYIPVHLQPFYRRRFGYGPGKCPVAESYYRRCLTLPLFPSMTDADVRRLISALNEVLET
jgi:perosamine synthetase